MNQDLPQPDPSAGPSDQPRAENVEESAAAGDAPTAAAWDGLRQELEDANDRALRARAELDNYRKRTQRELENERRYAALPLLRELLPVMDNVQRAIEAAHQSGDAGSLLEGFQMVAQQIHNVLAQQGCQPIAAEAGEPFDPSLHEAVSQLPSDQFPSGQIVQVTQAGYQLHDRVIRPSQVVVSSGPPPEGSQ
ncbi:MAG: nucleotide exchange factor GrpE [Planctomycetales bacterium]|nr:nucleotide exchange factor GrpE [Planctomycetales bacterium]NIP86289.1 nucleotide exchange factor GrpE [Planctomycetales bacterium]